MCFDEILYVESFPETFDLRQAKGREVLRTEVLGIREFRIVDTLLIASSNDKSGYWSFFSLPDMRPLGSFLRNGNGPGEFLSVPLVSWSTLRREADGLHAYLHDFRRGNLFDWQIDSTFHAGTPAIRRLADSLPPGLCDAEYLGSGRWLFRARSVDWTRMDRCFFADGRCETPPVLEPLNAAHVASSDGVSQNLVLAAIKYSPLRDRIVEAPVSLSGINIYAPDGSFARTVCVGNEIDDIDRLVDRGYWNFPNTFRQLVLFDDCWGVICFSEKPTQRAMELRSEHPRVICLFDWEGAPLAEIRPESAITAFDIDFAHGHLYTYDARNEEFCRYDVSDLLERL